MYLGHFSLREAPFSITPDPRFFYPGAGRAELLVDDQAVVADIGRLPGRRRIDLGVRRRQRVFQQQGIGLGNGGQEGGAAGRKARK